MASGRSSWPSNEMIAWPCVSSSVSDTTWSAPATTLRSAERYEATGVMIMFRSRGSRIAPPALKL
jgi:hypothetical protein